MSLYKFHYENMRAHLNKILCFALFVLLLLSSCWTNDYTKAKEDDFILNQKIIFEEENSDYSLLIRESGEEKPLRWYGREQCSKYRSARYDGDASLYVAYNLKNVLSTFGSLANKDIEVNSKKWNKTNFYIYFENKDSLSWDESRELILNTVIKVCNLQIDTIIKNVEINRIKVFDESLLHKKLTNHFEKASSLQISNKTVSINNTSLRFFANSIDELSKCRFQYNGADTNKYSFVFNLESINSIDEFNVDFKDVGVCIIGDYGDISHYIVKDRN